MDSLRPFRIPSEFSSGCGNVWEVHVIQAGGHVPELASILHPKEVRIHFARRYHGSKVAASSLSNTTNGIFPGLALGIPKGQHSRIT
jgi:hypothetical protein